jgi:DNA (cytosine-5)-methyltransferase 1
MTVFSRLSRFGMTFKPLTESRGEELLTLYLAGFPARTSVLWGGGQALLEANQECGNTWQGLLGRYDPSTHSLKTAQCSLFEDLKPSSVILPRWGSMQDGELYQRQTLVRPTSESEFGSEPNNETFFHTPTTGGLDGGSNSRKALKKRMENWPTPTAHNAKEAAYPAEFLRKTPTLAATVAMRKFPTPQASDNRDRGNMSNPSIQRRVAMGKQIMLSQSVDQNSGRLNPTWVECYLMGWPLEWTDLKPLETDKFQEWQQQHGDC